VVYQLAVPPGRSSVEAVKVFTAADGVGVCPDFDGAGAGWEPDWEAGCQSNKVSKRKYFVFHNRQPNNLCQTVSVTTKTIEFDNFEFLFPLKV
jgi:hypothetical protein